MERRDLIKEQIEQLGKVLGKILADFLGLKSKGQTSEAVEVSNQSFKNELDLDIEKILELNDVMLREYLQTYNLTAGHLEKIAAYLTQAGTLIHQENPKKSKNMLEKAIAIYGIADEITNTMSFERMNKRIAIENLLAEYFN